MTVKKESDLCCNYFNEGMEKVNAPLFLQAARTGGKGYDGIPFKYCPWCGGNIHHKENKEIE